MTKTTWQSSSLRTSVTIRYYQIILTAVVANRVRQDDIAVAVQAANWEAAELAYLKMTCQNESDSIAAVMERLSEWVAYQRNRDAYQTPTELLIAMIQQIKAEGKFPTANDAFDAGRVRSRINDRY
ncbi:MAG: hypothetical protein AAF327_09980 [Cyanobacteria bacterium P01_A01_bin.37]